MTLIDPHKRLNHSRGFPPLKQPGPKKKEATTPTESFTKTPKSEALVLPKLEEPSPSDLTRGYLWQAVPLPGPVDTILGAVISFGPIPKMMGLEPAPTGRPQPRPLNVDWLDAKPSHFQASTRHLESLLRDPDAKEVGKRRIRGGSNANFLVTLDNGASAVWSPTKGEKALDGSRKNIPQGTQAKREEAAYLVDRQLGHFARVPPAVSTGLEGREGSLKLLMSEISEDQSDRASFPPNDVRRMALFDHIIGNLDRHSGNFLKSRDDRPIPIDHGLAFPTANGEQGHVNFHFDATFQLNPAEKSMLKTFKKDRSKVEKDLSGLLEAEAVEAMYQRVDRMLELGWISHEWRKA